MNPTTIELLPASATRDQRLVAQVTDLVNLVFAEAEAGLWVDGARRTTPTEIALARVDGLVMGCVRVRQLDASFGELGMVAGHPGRRGARIDCDL